MSIGMLFYFGFGNLLWKGFSAISPSLF